MGLDADVMRQVAGATSRRALEEGIGLFARRALRATGERRSGGEIEQTYAVDGETLFLYLDGATRSLNEAACTCAEPRCGHAAAVLLYVLVGPPTRQAPWERELGSLIPAPQRQAPEFCVFVRVSEGGRVAGGLAVRPGVRGARGAWIKGNVSWSNVDDFGGIGGEILAELRDRSPAWGDTWGYYRPDPWIGLSDLAWRRLWPSLIELNAAGVAIVSDQKLQLPLRFETASVPVDVQVTTHGSGLRLRAELPGFASAPLWIGEPAAAVATVDRRGQADEQITFAALREPVPAGLRHLVERASALTIDRDGRERFEREYLPRLQLLAPVRSPDGSYDVPPVPRSELVLTVEYGEKQTHVTWAWDRGFAGIADPAHEATVWAAVRAALGDHTGIVGTTPEATATPEDRTLGLASAAIFGAELLPRLREVDDLRIVEAADAPAYRAAVEAPVVTISATGEAIDWFDLHVAVSVDGEDVDFAELFSALSVEDPILVLPSGTFFPLDSPDFDRLRAIIDEARMLGDRPLERLRIGRYQIDLWEELRELGIVSAQETAWSAKVRALAQGELLTRVDPPPGLRATLRDYQWAGFSWLHFLRTNGLGGVLADDMGLGKTLQAIAMMEAARAEDDGMPPFLIVAPTSVVGNWAAECARFAPELRVATIGATASRRGSTLAETVTGAHVVVTSYALFRLEFDDYDALDWSALLLDEAQLIKNHTGAGYSCARKLDVASKFVITGTPLENHLLELWALVSLTCPGLLGGRIHFTEFYRSPIEREQNAERLATLQRRLRPFLLRRTKDLVAAELPARQEQVQAIDLHPAHRRIYDTRLARERQKVLGLLDDFEANRFQIFRSLTMLRQLALDSELTDDGSAPSSKLDALDDLLLEVVDEGHKVLVFSQFTRFLGKARDRAIQLGVRHAYLDGKTTRRQKVIDDFRSGGAEVFFISLKSGGFGLNLVEADYVVLLDPWWNPATEQQAVDRAHRIGQSRPVLVYRMIATDTIESKVMALKASKSELFSRVLDGDGLTETGTLTTEDIRSLLE